MIASLPLPQGRQTLISAAIRYGSFPFDMITNAETSTTVQSNSRTAQKCCVWTYETKWRVWAGMAKASKSASKRRTKIFDDLTACLEDAHQHAVVGQSSRLLDAEAIAAIEAVGSLLEKAQRLLQSARDIAK